MKVGNHATLFLWEWALSRDKNNHRALSAVPLLPHHISGFLLPHYRRADLFMFPSIPICIEPAKPDPQQPCGRLELFAICSFSLCTLFFILNKADQ